MLCPQEQVGTSDLSLQMGSINYTRLELNQVNTPLVAKSKTRSKQNKDMHKFRNVYSERGVLLPILTSGGRNKLKPPLAILGDGA